MEATTNGDSKIRKVLQNELFLLVSIVGLVFSFVNYVILPIKSIQQDIDNIKNNHLHTIEMNMNELKTLNAKNVEENNLAHTNIMELLVKTTTILDQHLKK